MNIIRDPADLRLVVSDWKANGEKVAVVPTMGALHEGHLSLVRKARRLADRVITTIFVNPKQFDDESDLDAYPDTWDIDAGFLRELAVDVLFAPGVEHVYPQGFCTYVRVEGLSDVLCGAHRAGHFDGVATVVTKLLTMTRPDIAVFGEKDWQQLQIVKRLVTDLNLPVDIVPSATIREADGLAMSSRNLRLTTDHRRKAPALHRIMNKAAASIRNGQCIQDVVQHGRQQIEDAGFDRVDYLDVRRADNLELTEACGDQTCRLFVAAWIGGVRLIDNIAV